MALNMSHEKRVTVLSTLMEHVPGLQASPETSYEARIIYDTVVLKGLSFNPVFPYSCTRECRRSRPWTSGHLGGRQGRPRGRQVAPNGSV